MDPFKKASKDLTKVFEKYIENVAEKDRIASNLRFVVPPVQFKADFSTNGAMVAYKYLGKSMFDVAGELATKFKQIEYIKEVSVVKGYINFVFKDYVWEQFLTEVLSLGSSYGDGEKKKGKVLLEFVSANPTGPLHVGHCRGAILGLAIANLMKKAGYDVTKEYYMNDYGEQIATLVQSVQFRYEQVFKLHKNDSVPEGCYPGKYLQDYAKSLAKQFGDKFLNYSKEEFYSALKPTIVEGMMNVIRSDLKLLNLSFDSFASETRIAESGMIPTALEQLKNTKRMMKDDTGEHEVGLIYKGVLDAPLGGKGNAEDDDVNSSKLPQTLFRSTLFGDDRDRVVVRSDGKTTYFASDIAYHKNKIDRGYTHLINILGADHGGYVKRICGAVDALSNGKAKLDVILTQMVNLEKNGVPFKMSKRKGTFVLLSDVAKEVDVGELKLFMLSKSPETQMSFDLVKVKEKSKDNIVYYIQYAYARTHSVIQKYCEVFGEDYHFEPEHLSNFMSVCPEQIREIIVQLAEYSTVIKNSAEKGEPNILVEYLSTLVAKFHSLWNTDIRFVQHEDKEASKPMMAFVTCVQIVLQNSFDVLGIEAKKVM
jgi:arginyl-tRNA synthetase